MKPLELLKWLLCHEFLRVGSFQVDLAVLDHMSPSIPGAGGCGLEGHWAMCAPRLT